MEFVQILTSVAACADPQVLIHANNYEVMRTWLDFLFGRVDSDHTTNVVIEWALKQNASAPVDLLKQSIYQCGQALIGARGA